MVKVHYTVILGLSAAFRQMDLSLDRSRWTSWSALKAFFSERKEWIQCIDRFRDTCLQYSIIPQDHTYRRSVWHCFLNNFLVSKRMLTSQEMAYGLFLTEAVLTLLEESEPDKVKIELYRHRIAEYAHIVLIAKLKRKDALNVMRVEHYLENETNKTFTIAYIIK